MHTGVLHKRCSKLTAKIDQMREVCVCVCVRVRVVCVCVCVCSLSCLPGDYPGKQSHTRPFGVCCLRSAQAEKVRAEAERLIQDLEGERMLSLRTHIISVVYWGLRVGSGHRMWNLWSQCCFGKVLCVCVCVCARACVVHA